jgi:amidophosphoribosyltransferase
LTHAQAFLYNFFFNAHIFFHGQMPVESCGIFGIFGHVDASPLTVLGLHALQHRGQEGSGVCAYDGEWHLERHIGLVGDHFNRKDVLDRLPGLHAIGHNRYSTSGGSNLCNLQPLFCELDVGGLAIAHNGNLTNADVLRGELVRQGAIMQSTSDSEVLLHCVSKSRQPDFVKRFIDGLSQLHGAYSIIAMTSATLIGVRDPLGIRPLVMGELNGSIILASETCALNIVNANYIRDIENGEMVVIDASGVHPFRICAPMKPRPCIFEYIYFARPDSIVHGKSVYDVRKLCGTRLAQECLEGGECVNRGLSEQYVVVPVPDSGVPAAIGFAQESKLPYEMGIIRNHYVGRVFIEPGNQIRQLGVRLKHSPNSSVVRDKRILLVDDSIVRGTTSKKIVQLLRDAGAQEVHLRVASPPIRYPDYSGIDTPDSRDLIASRCSIEEIRRFIGADSLVYLSLPGLYSALGHLRDPKVPQFSDHYFTGEYAFYGQNCINIHEI